MGAPAGREDKQNKGQTRYVRILLVLHVLLFVYSFSGILSKKASSEPFLSLAFVLLYGGMLLVLAIYAVAWQQIVKRLPLTVAFANKAITVVWGIMWGALLFKEQVNAGMIVGAILVIAGIILYSTDASCEPDNTADSVPTCGEGITRNEK